MIVDIKKFSNGGIDEGGIVIDVIVVYYVSCGGFVIY